MAFFHVDRCPIGLGSVWNPHSYRFCYYCLPASVMIVGDSIVIRSGIIAPASRGENSSRGAHWEARGAASQRHRRPTREPREQSDHAASWSAVSVSRGSCFMHATSASPLSVVVLITLSLLQARHVGKLILSNYTDVTVAFHCVIKVWPASFSSRSMGRRHKLN